MYFRCAGHLEAAILRLFFLEFSDLEFSELECLNRFERFIEFCKSLVIQR